MDVQIRQLRARLAEINDLRKAAAVLNWDMQTYMPAAGAESRAEQVSTLGKTAHQWFVADEIGQLLEELEARSGDLDYDSLEASLVRVTRREYDRARKLPTALVADLAQATSLGHSLWQQARARSDFARFEPQLEKIVDLALQKAEALGYDENPYDALLDEFEPGMKTAQVAALFEEMRAGLVPLVEAISDRVAAVDGSLFDQGFDRDKQWEFGIEVLTALGFDFDRGRQDIAAHPFTTSFSTNDVRLTTRVYPHQFKTAIFGSIHESGHGMYNQGFDPTLNRTLLSSGASLGVHESQSRLWENIVGRSRGFWIHWLPRLKHYFPIQLDGISVEHFYRAINRVHPSFIRVEADEVTYNLHIFLRFEIENLMIQGQVKIADLPELWNDRMEEYLGIRPADAAQGVLQDVHWSHGLIGYFPTYALGNLLSVQLYNLAVADRPEIPASIKAGEYSPLLDWMRDHIHVHGRKYTPVELIERETGGPIRTGPFLEYIQTKYSEIYDL